MNEHEQLSFNYEGEEGEPKPQFESPKEDAAKPDSSEKNFIEVDDQCQYCGAPFESDRSCRYCAGNPTKRAYLKTLHK